MRYITALVAISMALLLQGCSKTKTIALHSETKMATGEHMSCIYHADSLYCASPLIKPEDIDKLRVMNRVVFVVHSEEKESDMKEGGAFSTRFPRKPKVDCGLLREADQKLVVDQEQQIKLDEEEKARQIKLNESGERILQSGLTEQDIVAKCGAPVERGHDIISHTIYFRSTQSGQNVEVRFSTLKKPTRLDEIKSVDESKTHEFISSGIFWHNFSDIGKTDEDHIADVRKYLPCILK